MLNNKSIAVLIPCLNEEVTIKKVIEDFKHELPHASIYVYDNNSTDNTYEIAKSVGATVRKEYKRGKGNVVLRMFGEIEADFFILVDGDDTYPATSAKLLLDTLYKYNASMVVGDRLSNKSYMLENKRKFHNFGNNFIKKIINVLFKANLKDILSGYRVFSRSFVKNYSSLATGFELETDLTLFALHYDLPIIDVPITYKDRPEGSDSKLNTFKDAVRIFGTIFNLYRFYNPLYFFSILALILFLLGLVLGIFPIYEYIKFQYVYRVPTAILALGLVIVSFLSFCCGLILDSIIKVDKKNTKMRIRKY